MHKNGAKGKKIKITVDEIRKKTSKKTKMDWYQSKLRNVSPYFTWFFLHIGISANQATIISIFPIIVGSFFFLFENPLYWILAWVIMQFYPIIDCADGEIARYKDNVTKLGLVLDEFLHPPINGLVLVFATFGLYFIYQSFYIFVFGFSALFFMFLNRLVNLSFRVKSKLISKANQKGIYGYRLPLGGLIHAFIIPSILDIFFSNFRLLFLVLLGIGIPVVFIKNIVSSYKSTRKN